jgi:uncharacterized protein
MYKIYCTTIDEERKPVILTYDPHTSTLLDEQGTDLGQLFKERVEQIGKENGDTSPIIKSVLGGAYDYGKAVHFNPENPIGKDSERIRILKIQMGLKCNYTCSYCSQAYHIEESFDTNNDDAVEFMSKMDTWLKNPPEKIEFWGGEPLVYWKKLQIMIPAMKAKYPNAMLSIITNGALLTREIIDFIVEYDIIVTISHDGPGQPLRGPDPLDDPEMKENWLYLFELRKEKIGINSVLTAKNTNPAGIRQWFKDKLGGEVVNIGLEGIVNAHDNNPDAVFTEEAYKQLESDVFFSLWNGEPPTSALWRRVRSFMETLITKNSSDNLWQKCGMDSPDQIAVDLLGNAMTCQNTGAKGHHNIGSVYDYENIKLDTSWHWTQRDECGHCPMLQLCQGSCMFLDGDDFAVTCENEYHYARPIFAFVLASFFGYVMLDIKGDIRRPKIKKKINIPVVVA